MAEIIYVPYVKDDNGNILPIAAIYDKDGNEITAKYQPKTGISLSKDSEGYTVINEE